jgi:PIN domain nuclease of toxin-antitoxin system
VHSLDREAENQSYGQFTVFLAGLPRPPPPENLIFVSAATLWELRTKEGIGKLELPQNFAEVVKNEAFESLSVTARHTEALLGLPMHHRDPFDRMLVAQARVEGLKILTRDKFIPLYDVDTLSA